MKGWTWLLIILAAILAAIIAVCVWAVKEVGEEQELEVLEHQLREEFWGPVVVGTAMNDTEQELSGVKAEVKWYGPGDVVLETDSDYLFGSLAGAKDDLREASPDLPMVVDARKAQILERQMAKFLNRLIHANVAVLDLLQ